MYDKDNGNENKEDLNSMWGKFLSQADI